MKRRRLINKILEKKIERQDDQIIKGKSNIWRDGHIEQSKLFKLEKFKTERLYNEENK